MDITLPWKEPNVFIFLLPKPEEEKINSLFEEFLMSTLGVKSLSNGLTEDETKQLTDAILKLDNEPFICYILVFIMDLNFSLDTVNNAVVNESIQKFLSQPCFKMYGPVIMSNLEDDDELELQRRSVVKKIPSRIKTRRKLEEKMGFYIYLNYEEYNDPKNIGIRLRKERIKKLNHLASL